MAKAAKTAIKKGVDENAKSYTEVIRAERKPNGAYSFKSAIVHKDKIDAYLKGEDYSFNPNQTAPEQSAETASN